MFDEASCSDEVSNLTTKPAPSTQDNLPDLPALSAATADEEPPAKMPKVDKKISAMQYLWKFSKRSQPKTDTSTDVHRFQLEPREDEDADPLLWWRDNEKSLPDLRLVKVAKSLLYTPATSTPSERLFSTTGFLCNKRRASLLPLNLAMLVFLHKTVTWYDDYMSPLSRPIAHASQCHSCIFPLHFSAALTVWQCLCR